MKHATHRLAWFMTFVVWFMFINFLIIILFWLIPRDIVDLDIVAHETSYSASVDKEIDTSIAVDIYGQAETSYTVKLICRNGTEQIWHLRTIVVTSQPNDDTVNSEVNYAIPPGATGHACVINIVSAHKVEVLPLITKTIYDSWESNTFEIKE